MVDEQIRRRTMTTPIFNDLPLLPEIWLQILTYLGHVDTKSASLTCQMAQTLLFHSHDPTLIDRDAQRQCLPGTAEVHGLYRNWFSILPTH